MSDIRKVRGDYDRAFSLMTGPKTQGYFPQRKLTHSKTTKHTHFPKFKENIQTGNGSLLQFENLISKKTNMFFVCFIEVCVFSNPSEEHASTKLETAKSFPFRYYQSMLWFQPLTFIHNRSKLMISEEFLIFKDFLWFFQNI